MKNRADPNLLLELKKYGEVNIESCFNCGNCTAICPLATDATPFPRNNLRMVQLGLRDRLLQSTDPWLCYYCGECSETCPRQAEPGEAQMTMRRWLTAQYDWTGLARRFYTSKYWEIGSVLFVGLLVVVAFALFHGPVVTDRVELNTFAPAHVVHVLDWIMFLGLAFFLLSNVFRMYIFTLRRGTDLKIPFSLYITEAWQLIYQLVTQSRWSKCDEDPEKDFLKKPLWRNHWILVVGYGIMLVLIVGFLKWFQTDEIYPIWHPQRWIGYLATIALLWGTAVMFWGRIKKDSEMHRFSHPSDWMFLILLFLTTVSGILVHIFRYMGLPLGTYYIYVIHLAILVPMLVLEVPFGKWSHLAYRPCAIYFQAVKEKALVRQAAETEMASVAA
ncbi:MAG: 4Fe-4S dicluster domain-containing protein [Chloroflexota bacterium]|nr:4Fe-4S dicluster domain-containing protein [Chloroflexota bacterium]